MRNKELSLRAMKTLRQRIQVFCLYYASFPASERKPFSIILKKQREGTTDVWCIEDDGRFAGFATTINGENLILLDYLAVSKARRGRGIGTGCLRKLQEKYAGKGLFVEIESVYEEGAGLAERRKRKEFYLRNGLKELGVLADVFGVRMELLGRACELDFDGYRSSYREYYSPWAAEHLEYVEFPKK